MYTVNNSDLIFGPVPSRRLGRSLGVNNIPAKLCSYSCVYCQLGRTITYETKRSKFYEPDQIIQEVAKKVNEVESRGEKVDYVTFVPDGEPTLDINLGQEIEKIKNMGIRTAVITNSSLIYLQDVQNDLSLSDWVSLKIDTVNREKWIRINRPHPKINFNEMLLAMQDFSNKYTGYLATETMLVNGIQDENDLIQIASFVASMKNLRKSYISIPTRPPAEGWVIPPTNDLINIAYQIFSRALDQKRVEYLIEYEGDDFAVNDNPINSILSIISVHPMKREAIERLLQERGIEWEVFQGLVDKNIIIELKYGKDIFYMKSLPGRKRN